MVRKRNTKPGFKAVVFSEGALLALKRLSKGKGDPKKVVKGLRAYGI